MLTEGYKGGCHKISFTDYLADPAPSPSLTRTTIKDLLFRSPRHAFYGHSRLNPDYQAKEAERFDIGTAAHALLLDGKDIIEIIDAADWRTKAAKEARDEARAKGKIPLLTAQTKDIFAMVNAANSALANSELAIVDLQKEGDSELTYIWNEGKTWCRIRPDWISKDRTLVLDYKTVGNSANPSDISRQIISFGYDIQAAFYTRGVREIEGTEPKFIFLFQEIEEPYLCSFIGLPPQFMDMGASKVDYGLFLWRQCLEKNEWPGYPQRICWVEPPTWALAQWEQISEGIGI